jgi:hypothetical protein
MALTTAEIGIQQLMDSTVNMQEIEARIAARVFAAVHQPERGACGASGAGADAGGARCHQPGGVI